MKKKERVIWVIALILLSPLCLLNAVLGMVRMYKVHQHDMKYDRENTVPLTFKDYAKGFYDFFTDFRL